MSKDEIDEIKKELEEQKRRNEEMAKLLKDVYKKLDVSEERRERPAPKLSEAKKTAEEILARDLYEVENNKHRVHRAPRPARPAKPARPARPAKPAKPVMPAEFNFEYFRSDEFKEKMKDIDKKVAKAAAEGKKMGEKIAGELEKKLGKFLEKETERIKKSVKISKEELGEINSEIDDARREIDQYQRDMDQARRGLAQAKQEVRAAQRRIERARQREDTEEKLEAEESLRDAIEDLNDAEEDTREIRSELAQARREFARLQRRASKIHHAGEGQKGPRVVRIGDVDVDGTVTDYITRVMDSVGKSMESTFRTAFGDSKKASVARHTVKTGFSDDEEDTAIVVDIQDEDNHVIKKAGNFYDKTALLLSALGDQHRIKILKILEESPQYQKELAQITGLKGGSFKHHTDILQEADFITREAVRGRYLITQLGIEALKLGEMIYLRKKRLENEDEEESINIDIED
jgi:hypothetical protein